MSESKGVIYILTNPSFPDFVKIGYASDMDRRLGELNRSECIPFAFRVYATYEVDSNLSDKKIHAIIDKLNPNLRSIDDFNGQKRIREFYAMSKEDAYSIFEAIAEIHNRTDKLNLYKPNAEEAADERAAEDISAERKERAAPFTFSMCNIPIGAELEFWPTTYKKSEVTCVVADDKKVKYDGELYSLSGLGKKLLNSKWSVHGPAYFKYNGEWLNEIRDKMEKTEE